MYYIIVVVCCRRGGIGIPACRQAGTQDSISEMYYVYVLRSLKNGHCYKGMCVDIDKRLREHKSGKCRSTRLMESVKLVFVQVCQTRLEARELEKYLKSGTGREIIVDIT